MKVLVATEHSADDRKTLAAVRALADAGAEVTVGSDVPTSPPLWSRFCRGRIRYPSPVNDPSKFSRWILEELPRYGFDVLLPLSDYTTVGASINKDRLSEKMGVPVPDPGPLAQANDKLAVIELARSLGIGVPSTLCPTNRDELERISSSIDYPCVFKLRKGAGAIGLGFPTSRDELLRHYDGLGDTFDTVFTTDRPLIQEYIPGTVHDACLLYSNGQPRASMTQRRLLMYPSQGGVGIYNETTAEKGLLDQAQRLLGALKWHGPAMVEFKLDPRDHRFKLMEINSRYWGTLDLAIQAGMNFPWLACRIATEGDIEPLIHYRVGTRYRWTWPHGIRYALHNRHRLRTLATFLKPQPNTHNNFRLSDPLPHILHSREFFR